jgi:hypothetical protein
LGGIRHAGFMEFSGLVEIEGQKIIVTKSFMTHGHTPLHFKSVAAR